VFFTHGSPESRTPLVASRQMDRTRRRTTGRSLVGLVVLAAALYGGVAASGRLDTHPASDAQGSASRHAALHEHSATLRALLPMRVVDRVTKSGWRETFALAVGAFAVALAYAARRRVRTHRPQLLAAYVRFGAPRAPPALQLQP
jgi:hypothetical protein